METLTGADISTVTADNAAKIPGQSLHAVALAETD